MFLDVAEMAERGTDGDAQFVDLATRFVDLSSEFVDLGVHRVESSVHLAAECGDGLEQVSNG